MSDAVTSSVPGPVSLPALSVKFFRRDGSSGLASSREEAERTSVPSPCTTPVWLLPSLILTVLPEPMQATSVEVGTWAADQSATVAQLPSLGPVHVSVQSDSACASDGTATKAV